METSPIQGAEPGVASIGLLRRIWKYRLHYIIVIPALFLILFFKIFPLITGIVMPFKDYRMTRGLFGSAWIGMDNFSKLFASPQLRTVLANSLIIKLEYIAASVFIALAVTLAISGIRSRWLRKWTSTMVLVPYFIPSVVVAYVVSLMLAPNHLEKLHLDLFVLGDSRFFRPLLAVIEALKTCGIPILIALTAIEARHAVLAAAGTDDMTGSRYLNTHVIPAIRAISAFALLQLSTILSTDFELVWSLQNPLISQVSLTVDTFALRTGLFLGNFNEVSALHLLQFVVHLICTLAAYYLIRGCFYQDLFTRFENVNSIRTENKRSNGVGIAFSLVCFLLLLLFIYYICIYPFTIPSVPGKSVWHVLPVRRYLVYILINLAAVIINTFITATLAYPLTVRDLPGRSMYKIWLILMMVAGAGFIPEYLFIHTLGMVNTVYPQMIFGLFSIVNVFVVKSIFNSKYARLKEQAALEGHGELYSFFMVFIPKVWKALIALGVLQFVAMWNSFYVSMLYMGKPDTYSPVATFEAILAGTDKMGVQPGDPVFLQLAAVISIPSIVLLLIFRRWLTSEVLLSQVRKL